MRVGWEKLANQLTVPTIGAGIGVELSFNMLG